MKIFSIHELAVICERLKKEGKTIVHCHGCFDLFHAGHVEHFKSAAEYGSVLVVTVTADGWVNKGPDRPFFPAKLRAEVVAALQCVDFVSINHGPNAERVIKLIKPDYYVKGIDYKNAAANSETAAAKEVGARLVYTETPKFSSTKLLEKLYHV